MDTPDLPIENLLEQVEEFRLRRQIRDARPDRITQFITDMAAVFEPLRGIGRVGFECRAVTNGWAISMYLGATEVVGGRDDGLAQHTAFRFDVSLAGRQFTQLDAICFTSQPGSGGALDCGVTLTGYVDEYPIRLAVHAVPPGFASPGFQRLPDRSLRLTQDDTGR